MGMNLSVYAGPVIQIKAYPKTFNITDFCEEICNESLTYRHGPDNEDFLLPNTENLCNDSYEWCENQETFRVTNLKPKKIKRKFKFTAAEELAILEAMGVVFKVKWVIFSYYS